MKAQKSIPETYFKQKKLSYNQKQKDFDIKASFKLVVVYRYLLSSQKILLLIHLVHNRPCCY